MKIAGLDRILNAGRKWLTLQKLFVAGIDSEWLLELADALRPPTKLPPRKDLSKGHLKTGPLRPPAQ